MSKVLSLMMAVALSAAATSAMASTVNQWVNPSNGTVEYNTDITMNNGDSINFGGTNGVSKGYSDNWTINVGGATGSAVGTYTATVALGNPTANQIYGMTLTDGLHTWNAFFNSSNSNWVIAATLMGHTVYNLAINGIGSYTGNIQAVPLPAAGLLFGSALLGIAALGRKKRDTNQADAVAA